MKYPIQLIEQKGMTFDHDFGYFFFSSFLKKEERRKGEWLAKIVIKSHAFLLDPFSLVLGFFMHYFDWGDLFRFFSENLDVK